jgi:hypothetical protein
MTINYTLWQGSNLLAIDQIANSVKEIDELIKELNSSDLAKSVKFSANVRKIEVNK